MSKEAIEGLEPKIIWEQFYGITQIPRPSKKEEKIIEYVKGWAGEHNFAFDEDAVGNLVIHIPATEGHENAPVTVIQGHMDMVCEKNKGTEHDFENDPIKLIRDGEWLTADGTTLGADNGIGVAAGFAAALDPEVIHGPLELLCTVDEETGLTGANNLQPGFIKGDTLLNLDSEEDGAFYVGCSGGQDTIGLYDIPWQKNKKKKYAAYELMITGLKGGHSGLDVANGRANAIILLAKLLNRCEGIKFRIASIAGGSKRNAIPREAEAVLLVKVDDVQKFKVIIDQFVSDTLLEFAKNDGGLKVTFEPKEGSYDEYFRKDFGKLIIDTLLALPHGIIAMSEDIEGLVETSTNLATVEIAENLLRVGTSQRSSIESAKVDIANKVSAVFKLSGADEIEFGDGYPGWQPNMDSELLKTGKRIFTEMYNKDPEIKAIHAGLECGILGDKFPGLDMISFGPTIHGAHSPDERLNIADVGKFYNLVKAILKERAELNK